MCTINDHVQKNCFFFFEREKNCYSSSNNLCKIFCVYFCYYIIYYILLFFVFSLFFSLPIINFVIHFFPSSVNNVSPNNTFFSFLLHNLLYLIIRCLFSPNYKICYTLFPSSVNNISPFKIFTLGRNLSNLSLSPTASNFFCLA